MSDLYAHPASQLPPGAGQSAPWATLPGYGPPQERRTNGFAVAALVFGIIGGVLLAVIFGIVALVQIPKKNQKGKGLAFAGLVLAGAWTLAIVAAIVAIIMTSASRDSSGEITDAGDVSAFKLETGDCVSDLELSRAITSLPAVPCDEPHQAEVVGVFDLPDGEYPSGAELTSQADAGCADRLSLYAPTAMNDSSLQISYLYPLEKQWPTDREVVCFAVATTGTMTGSIAD